MALKAKPLLVLLFLIAALFFYAIGNKRMIISDEDFSKHYAMVFLSWSTYQNFQC